MTKKMAASVTAAKARTKAAPLVGAAPAPERAWERWAREDHAQVIQERAQVAATKVAAHQDAVRDPGVIRIAYVAVRQNATGEYLDMLALTNTRASAENFINERQRINATALRKGMMDPYLRVARIEIREVPEEEVS